MSSIPFDPHLRFGQCVSGRYQVFNTVRHEKVFSLMKVYDLAEDEPVYLFTFPRAMFRDFPQARAQLEFQADQLRRLSSPFLVNLMAMGEVEGLFFFVEEHPRGESLAQILRERREGNQPFSDREALGLCWLLCRALADVQKSTVHGFLHPQDIYIRPWPDGPIPFYPRIAHIGVRTMLRAVRMPLEGLEKEAACYPSPEFEAYGPLRKQVDVWAPQDNLRVGRHLPNNATSSADVYQGKCHCRYANNVEVPSLQLVRKLLIGPSLRLAIDYLDLMRRVFFEVPCK